MLDLKTAIGISLGSDCKWIVEPANQAIYYINDKTDIVDYYNNHLDFRTLYKLGKRYIGLNSDTGLMNFIPKQGLWVYSTNSLTKQTTLELITGVTEEGIIINNSANALKYDANSITVLTPFEVENVVKNVTDFIKG